MRPAHPFSSRVSSSEKGPGAQRTICVWSGIPEALHWPRLLFPLSHTPGKRLHHLTLSFFLFSMTPKKCIPQRSREHLPLYLIISCDAASSIEPYFAKIRGGGQGCGHIHGFHRSSGRGKGLGCCSSGVWDGPESFSRKVRRSHCE